MYDLIIEYMEENGGAELPEIQEKFGLSYKEAKQIMGELVYQGQVKYDSGVRYVINYIRPADVKKPTNPQPFKNLFVDQDDKFGNDGSQSRGYRLPKGREIPKSDSTFNNFIKERRREIYMKLYGHPPLDDDLDDEDEIDDEIDEDDDEDLDYAKKLTEDLEEEFEDDYDLDDDDDEDDEDDKPNKRLGFFDNPYDHHNYTQQSNKDDGKHDLTDYDAFLDRLKYDSYRNPRKKEDYLDDEEELDEVDKEALDALKAIDDVLGEDDDEDDDKEYNFEDDSSLSEEEKQEIRSMKEYLEYLENSIWGDDKRKIGDDEDEDDDDDDFDFDDEDEDDDSLNFNLHYFNEDDLDIDGNPGSECGADKLDGANDSLTAYSQKLERIMGQSDKNLKPNSDGVPKVIANGFKNLISNVTKCREEEADALYQEYIKCVRDKRLQTYYLNADENFQYDLSEQLKCYISMCVPIKDLETNSLLDLNGEADFNFKCQCVGESIRLIDGTNTLKNSSADIEKIQKTLKKFAPVEIIDDNLTVTYDNMQGTLMAIIILYNAVMAVRKLK